MINEKFKKIEPKDLKNNIFKLWDDEWFLITAGNKDKFNCMTASWGGFGILWNLPVSFIFVRPTRYTFNFVEKAKHFTLTTFYKRDKKILSYCGKVSGKDHDKVSETGLKPLFLSDDIILYEQIKLGIVCEKLYLDDLKEKNFLDKVLLKNYPKKDYHRLYVGKIKEIYIRKK
ncbi:MAG: flavin reductase family protein [bacterium]|uniref:Flavoprotein oxygenase DIM6/NTAB associated protein n=2 Tax=Bacteria candidate phyla TaxID=1783234 RepID=A0A101I235_UNCT6|nr:MAG: flavoprotein oxygenase associated protein [candidate division TA06 bacterium 32_111]KUK86818.1 MAG: flavoprotein oxygenase DIM6/NTAB associated protein [candidate division TA06 bacterium 34_109]MDI6700793.1 flavin reductase family protein [bacterium]HCP16830.1 flavin reductase [candidate division WOR-3 bacterium]